MEFIIGCAALFALVLEEFEARRRARKDEGKVYASFDDEGFVEVETHWLHMERAK